MTGRLDYPAAAAYLGVKPTTLRSMVHRNQVPYIRLTPCTVVFDCEQLDRFLAEKAIAVGAPLVRVFPNRKKKAAAAPPAEKSVASGGGK